MSPELDQGLMMQATSEEEQRLSQTCGRGGNTEVMTAREIMHVADDVAQSILSYHRVSTYVRSAPDDQHRSMVHSHW